MFNLFSEKIYKLALLEEMFEIVTTLICLLAHLWAHIIATPTLHNGTFMQGKYITCTILFLICVPSDLIQYTGFVVKKLG